MRRGEIFREKGREERDWEGNERERESLEGGRETETEMLGEGKKIRQREKETSDKERCGNRGRSREGEGHRGGHGHGGGHSLRGASGAGRPAVP